MSGEGARLASDILAGHIIMPESLAEPTRGADWVGRRLVVGVAAGGALREEMVAHDEAEEVCSLADLTAAGPTALDEMVALDQAVFDELGQDYADEPWSRTNFANELPGKLVLSFAAKGNSGLVGFWIGSEKMAGEAHTHRLAVAAERRQGDVARRLFCAFWLAVRERPHLSRMTVEMGAENRRAQRFYRGLGYRPMDEGETRLFLAARGRGAQRMEGAIIVEDNGARSMVMDRPIEGRR
jgi:ribosomal protein S18 acetylase RimI-like enzyme